MSLLYGCEGWLGVKPSADIKTMYLKAVKLLLGVRQTTTNEVCLFEAGLPSLEGLIRAKQKAFFDKMLDTRRDMQDDPLMFAIHLTMNSNRVMARYITGLQNAGDITAEDLEKRSAALRASPRTKSVTYCAINPSLTLHDVYGPQSRMCDHLRINFTRLRVSSHRLRVETGRWARTPHEERLCRCGNGVQDEEHAVSQCELVAAIRAKYGVTQPIVFRTWISAPKTVSDMNMLREILAFFE